MDFQDLEKMALYKNYLFRCFSFENQIYVFWEKQNKQLTNLPYIYYSSYSPELRMHLNKLWYNNFCFFSAFDWIVKDASKLYVVYKFLNPNTFSSSFVKKYNQRLKQSFIYTKSPFLWKTLKHFYVLYRSFFQDKKKDFHSYDYFENLFYIFWDLLSFWEVSIDWETLASVILLRYQRKIIPLFWWYKGIYIKEGLKYFFNISLIEYYKNDESIDEIIFWSWVDPRDQTDSLFQFKKKFGTVYSLKEELCF